MTSLIQTVMDALSPDILSRIGGLIGEGPSVASKGMEGATAALLAGAVQHAETPSGASQLLHHVMEATAGGSPLNSIGGLLESGPSLLEGSPQVAGLLGQHQSSVASQLGSHFGLGQSAITGLLGVAAPLVLGAIRQFLGANPTAGALQTLLQGQKSSILGALPIGLRSLLGPTVTSTTAAHLHEKPQRSGINWLPWILAALALLALLFLLRTCQKEEPVASNVEVRDTVDLNLPGGGTLNVRQNSIGYSVARFLESTDPAPRTFVFDNLNFDTASNALTPESRPTVDALATILKAYPSARGRVVGYTDNQGDPAANKALSDARATTVKNELVARGVAADRIEKAGMGEQNPIADNATEDGRAKNRRTEFQITAK